MGIFNTGLFDLLINPFLFISGATLRHNKDVGNRFLVNTQTSSAQPTCSKEAGCCDCRLLKVKINK